MAARRLRRSPSGSRVQLDDEPINPSEWERLVSFPNTDVELTNTNAPVLSQQFAEPMPVQGDSLIEIDASLAVSFSSGTAFSGTVGGILQLLDTDGNPIGGAGAGANFSLPRARSPVGQADSNYAQGALVTYSAPFYLQIAPADVPADGMIGGFRLLASASSAAVAWLFDRQAFTIRRLR